MKIYKVAIETLLQEGFVELWINDEPSQQSDYVGAVIYDLALTNTVQGYALDNLVDKDILLYEYFENPLEPTDTELSLFELEFGFGLEFIKEPS